MTKKLKSVNKVCLVSLFVTLTVYLAGSAVAETTLASQNMSDSSLRERGVVSSALYQAAQDPAEAETVFTGNGGTQNTSLNSPRRWHGALPAVWGERSSRFEKSPLMGGKPRYQKVGCSTPSCPRFWTDSYKAKKRRANFLRSSGMGAMVGAFLGAVVGAVFAGVPVLGAIIGAIALGLLLASVAVYRSGPPW